MRIVSTGRTLLLLGAALAVSSGLTACWAWSGSECYTGFLRAESTSISANRDGTIQTLLLAEGATAETGAPLLTVIDDSLVSQIAESRQRVELLRTELDQARARADVDLKWRNKELEAEILQTQLKSAGYLKTQYDLQMQKHAWNEHESRQSGFGADQPPQSVIQAVRVPDDLGIQTVLKQEAVQNAIQVADAQVELCEQRLDELKRLKEQLPDRIDRANGVGTAEARLQAAAATLTQLERQQREIEVVAPSYGTVGIYRKRPGERVRADETIVELLDEDRRFLLVAVPSRELAAVTADSAVSLEFPGGKMRAGKVRQIPPQTTTAAEDNSSRGDALVPVRIDPTGRLWPSVPIGTAVKVKFAE